jgi:hypothetical protein
MLIRGATFPRTIGKNEPQVGGFIAIRSNTPSLGPLDFFIPPVAFDRRLEVSSGDPSALVRPKFDITS